jgi:adenylosuccinate synthase
MSKGTIYCVVGGQYGSEAKGHVAAQLHLTRDIPCAVRVGGANAGHTVIDENGVRFPLRTIPVAAAVDHYSDLVIAAGSEIDLTVLSAEIDLLESAGHPVKDRLHIDPEATIVDVEHKQQEAEAGLVGQVGSTGKGIGAARAARMLRKARTARESLHLAPYLTDTSAMLNDRHQSGADILIEGTQGYHLGLHAGHYPQSTTNDCRAIDVIAQAGVTPLNRPEIWLVFRTYPIRVAGNSGEMGKEISWEVLGGRSGGYIQPERTTVTNLVRRVAEWDHDAARMAIDGNGGAGNDKLHLALTMVDYLDPDLEGTEAMSDIEASHAMAWIEQVEDELGISFSAFGTSPQEMVFR